MMSPDDLSSDVVPLATVFFRGPTAIGDFVAVEPAAIPAPSRALLAHDDHMTVTHEAFFGSLVDVHVLAEHRDGTVYTRKSLLSRQTDGAVVQYGIMQIDLAQIGEAAGHEITEEHVPLGRVLIRHNILRHVELIRLYRIRPNEELATALAVQADALVYGRTARIHVNGRPAIELLEIVCVPEAPS